MRFTYSEMWWFTSRELRVALVLMFLARFAYLSVLSVSSNDDEAPLLFVARESRKGEERENSDGTGGCLFSLQTT